MQDMDYFSSIWMFTNMYLDHVDFRFGIGRFTTEAEIDYTAEKCIEHVSRLREMRYVIYRQIYMKYISVRNILSDIWHMHLSDIQDAFFC